MKRFFKLFNARRYNKETKCNDSNNKFEKLPIVNTLLYGYIHYAAVDVLVFSLGLLHLNASNKVIVYMKANIHLT